MEWLKLLIPIIAVAVYIISQLAANQQNRRKPAPRPLPPPDDFEPPRERRPSPDLEKFLEEVRQRKEEKDRRQEAEAEEPPRRQPEPRRRLPVTTKPPRRRDEPVIVVQPASLPAGSSSRTVTMPSSVPAGVAPVQATQAPPPPPQALHRPEALPTRTPQSASVKMVGELLKNRQALSAALLLREILGPPLSRRRRP